MKYIFLFFFISLCLIGKNSAVAQTVITENDPCLYLGQTSDNNILNSSNPYFSSPDYREEDHESPNLYETHILRPPQKIEFPLTIDMADFIGLELPQGIEGISQLGIIRVENGRVFWNDTELSDQHGVDLESFCRQQKKRQE